MARCYASLARLSKDPQNSYRVVDWENEGTPDCECLQFLTKSLAMIENAVGFLHPETATLYESLAGQYIDMNSLDDASPPLRRTFCITSKLFGTDSEVTRETWRRLKEIEVFMNSNLQSVPIEELAVAIEDLELQHQNDEEDEDEEEEEEEEEEEDEDI